MQQTIEKQSLEWLAKNSEAIALDIEYWIDFDRWSGNFPIIHTDRFGVEQIGYTTKFIDNTKYKFIKKFKIYNKEHKLYMHMDYLSNQKI